MLGINAAKEELRTVNLNSIAKIIMGQSPPGSTYNNNGNGLPFFQGTKDFKYRHPTPRIYCSSPSRIAQPGDILFSVRAPIGRINTADSKCAIGRGLAIIKPFHLSDTRFLEYTLRSLESTWDILESEGTVYGNVRKQFLEKLPLRWPRKEERSFITKILGTLDDKIEVNRQQNEALREMARTLFKSWFVDPASRAASHAKIDAARTEWKTRNFGDCAVLIRNTVPPSQFGENLTLDLNT